MAAARAILPACGGLAFNLQHPRDTQGAAQKRLACAKREETQPPAAPAAPAARTSSQTCELGTCPTARGWGRKAAGQVYEVRGRMPGCWPQYQAARVCTARCARRRACPNSRRRTRAAGRRAVGADAACGSKGDQAAGRVGGGQRGGGQRAAGGGPLARAHRQRCCHAAALTVHAWC